jgi:cellulose synthase/poly-beta-1,6-N-acetylglucosamine synthase-like glycosyltransferase
VDVKLSGSRSKAGERTLKWALGLLLACALVAPGVFWPTYFRILATVLFVGVGLISLRAILAGFLTFKPSPVPPPKPASVDWPTVSVLVVAYNEAAVLPRTMASMLHLDYPHDKIEFVYVYEKRSTDGTGAVVRSFAERDARFVPVERDSPRGGKAAATNYGLDHCTGEFLLSLDADHSVEPHIVKRAVQHMLGNPRIGCVKGRAMGMNPGESFLANLTKVERDAIEKGDIYVRDVVHGFTFFGGGQAFFRRSVFESVGRFDEEILVEDIDFSTKLHAAGWDIRVDPEIRTHEENPARLKDWWAQRKRWGRGWMQVAKRYMPQVLTMPNISAMQRADLAFTLLYVLMPVLFVAGIPLKIVGAFGYDTRTYIPWDGVEAVGWTLFGLTPFIGWGLMWLQDRRDGVRHAAVEAVGYLFLQPYLMFQTLVFWDAFLEEFILQKPSVYVKTTKTGGELPLTKVGVAEVLAEAVALTPSQKD